MPFPTLDRVSFKKMNFSEDYSKFISKFNCDKDDEFGCHEFIHKEEESKDFQEKRLGITYLFFYEGEMIAFVTLAMSSIDAKRIEKEDVMIRLKFFPSLLIGRLAVRNDLRKKGIGKFLCEWSTGVSIELSNKIGCRYVVLETSESKVDFYSKCDFKECRLIEDDDSKHVWMYKRTVID